MVRSREYRLYEGKFYLSSVRTSCIGHTQFLSGNKSSNTTLLKYIPTLKPLLKFRSVVSKYTPELLYINVLSKRYVEWMLQFRANEGKIRLKLQTSADFMY